MTPDESLSLLDEIADRADALALQYFRQSDLRVDEKPDRTPVSEADRAIEAMVRQYLSARDRTLGVLGEEEGPREGSSGRRLIIDPIDATQNFIRGIPIFATLLAVEVEGEVVAGVASAPALRTRWRAARGVGAFEGTRRLAVTPTTALANVQLFHGDVGGTAETAPPPPFATLASRVLRTRGFGDFYQHVLVAQGSGDAGIDPVVHPWDVAALYVIVEEAGGRATTLNGDRSIYGGSLVTSNGYLHDEILRALQAS